MTLNNVFNLFNFKLRSVNLCNKDFYLILAGEPSVACGVLIVTPAVYPRGPRGPTPLRISKPKLRIFPWFSRVTQKKIKKRLQLTI